MKDSTSVFSPNHLVAGTDPGSRYHREISPESYRYQDLAISDLSAELRSRLQESKDENWFASLGFAASYCAKPAQRVSFLEGSAGEVIEKCFYRETTWGGVFKQIEIFGPTDPGSSLLRQLQQRSRAHMMRVKWVTARDSPLGESPWKSFVIRQTTEDYCIKLPKTSAEYLQNLGSSTRKHLPYYLRRLQKEWGSEWDFEEKRGTEISEKSYERLFELNRLRMGQKGRRSAWSRHLQQQRWKLTQESGLLCSLRFQGQMVGGTLSFLHGHGAYLIVLAHDPQFDRLNLGNISLWLSIQYLIRSGYKRYHLMWGRSSYKEQLGGRIQPLYDATLFANSFVAALWRVADSLMMLTGWSIATRLRRKIRLYLPGRHLPSVERADPSTTPPEKRQQGVGSG
jgi:hypothetical protein